MSTDPKALADQIDSLLMLGRIGLVGDLVREHRAVILAALRAHASAEGMRERAAKLCEDKARKIDPFNVGTCGDIMRPTYEECATLIRALPLDPGSAS